MGREESSGRKKHRKAVEEKYGKDSPQAKSQESAEIAQDYAVQNIGRKETKGIKNNPREKKASQKRRDIFMEWASKDRIEID